MSALNQIFMLDFQNAVIGIIGGSIVIFLAYLKLGNKLAFKIIFSIMVSVAFSADAAVLLISVQILDPGQYLYALIVIFVSGFIVVVLVAYYLRNQIILPLNKISTEADGLLNGNLTVKIDKISRNDEIGSLTNSLSELFNLLNSQSMVEKLSDSVQS